MLSKKQYCVDVVCTEKKVRLRCAELPDIEYLRLLKNAHRQFFFYKQEITEEQQEVWYSAYHERLDDFMFIVWLDDNKIGCMGIRLLDNKWDVYNVILGDNEFKGTGIMGQSFQAMLSFARGRRDAPIGLSVLKNNPAIWWYKKNGFKIDSETPDHFEMSFNQS
jgi:RimJ/RimL family protein N-acetyltransferase